MPPFLVSQEVSSSFAGEGLGPAVVEEAIRRLHLHQRGDPRRPGSHTANAPQRAADIPTDKLVAATMTAGSVLIYDGRPVHGGGPTRSDSGRIGLIVEHVARWRQPNENHTLTVPIRLAATLLELLQEFLGYNQLNPYLGFVAGRSPREWLHGPGEPNT